MSQRLDCAQQAPELFKKYLDFSLALKKGSLEPGLQHLVTLRASQLNGCAFCVDMHVKEARLHGERELRLHHVAIWHESPLFSARERAALAWTEVLTRLPAQGVSEADYQAVRAEFNEQETADLSFAIVGINGWNRLCIGFAAVPGSQDKAYGLDKAGLA
ncbi:carboxymuconolactone decarboxylase family protein [Hylemonella gracilis]|uniref:Alkylhydroperoxidase like protein, AhpD family n=1 Tax=Hylemonella gracilis ATCC 19624 TaxID=887062 RepID=F3KT88_9BURK|nr:carboxymuconolactone decarboxylase family protein [Hylemonella gracilis]EGI76989.1 alkylhydroperoxidase like protein, AhpD family [Hylemonella gracilis ATCC 19624]